MMTEDEYYTMVMLDERTQSHDRAIDRLEEQVRILTTQMKLMTKMHEPFLHDTKENPDDIPLNLDGNHTGSYTTQVCITNIGDIQTQKEAVYAHGLHDYADGFYELDNEGTARMIQPQPRYWRYADTKHGDHI